MPEEGIVPVISINGGGLRVWREGAPQQGRDEQKKRRHKYLSKGESVEEKFEETKKELFREFTIYRKNGKMWVPKEDLVGTILNVKA